MTAPAPRSEVLYANLPILRLLQVTDEAGNRLGPGEEGELRWRSPVMMLGYLKMEEETKDYFDEEGFAKSGDLAKYDADGKIVITGRIKEQIT